MNLLTYTRFSAHLEKSKCKFGTFRFRAEIVCACFVFYKFTPGTMIHFPVMDELLFCLARIRPLIFLLQKFMR